MKKVFLFLVLFSLLLALPSCKAFRLTTEGTEIVVESAHLYTCL